MIAVQNTQIIHLKYVYHEVKLSVFVRLNMSVMSIIIHWSWGLCYLISNVPFLVYKVTEIQHIVHCYIFQLRMRTDVSCVCIQGTCGRVHLAASFPVCRRWGVWGAPSGCPKTTINKERVRYKIMNTKVERLLTYKTGRWNGERRCR